MHHTYHVRLPRPSTWIRTLWLSCLCLSAIYPVHSTQAQTEQGTGSRWQRFKQMRETQRENKAAVVSEASLGALPEHLREDRYGDRDMLVYVPNSLPASGQRALLVVLHGGGGNARFMQEHLKIDGVAEKNGFVVAYLNGSAAARLGGDKLKAWNAGKGCCGKPYTDKVDDVGYITGAVRYLQQQYGATPERTYGAGHSNGAMMMQTMACLTPVFKHVATLAGTLMAEARTCPAASQHVIDNYHGELDQNVPIAGGKGTKGVTNISFTSQAQAKAAFESSGGRYVLHVLEGADHAVEHLSEASERADQLTIAERLARDLGLTTAP